MAMTVQIHVLRKRKWMERYSLVRQLDVVSDRHFDIHFLASGALFYFVSRLLWLARGCPTPTHQQQFSQNKFSSSAHCKDNIYI